MGVFLCQISERDWLISHKLGVYGNRINKSDGSGPLNKIVRLSIIRDLMGIKENDIVLFHVIKKIQGGESSIHGVYKARSVAYFDTDKIWNDLEDSFPYRFLFEPHPSFKELCLVDTNIDVSEFYTKIEQQKIWSQVTLENEINIEGRAVRKIAEGDGQEIIKLLLRDFPDKNTEELSIELISPPCNKKELRAMVEFVGSIENAVKALLLYELRKQTDFINNTFGNVVDFMNEVFVAQTIRKLFDLIVISKTDNGLIYDVLEFKTNGFNVKELRQLLGYLDLFRQRRIFNINSDIIIGTLVSKTTHPDIIEFVSMNNKLEVFDKLRVINYEPQDNGSNANFSIHDDQDINDIDSSMITEQNTCSFNYDAIQEESILKLSFIKRMSVLNINFASYKQSKDTYVILQYMNKQVNRMNKIGEIYLHFCKDGFGWEQLREFLNGLREHVELSSEKDYMEVVPIIVTTKTNKTVQSYINLYNKLYRRKQIRLYIANSI